MIDISVKNLTKFFVIGENLLEDLTFEIQEGERVAIAAQAARSNAVRPVT